MLSTGRILIVLCLLGIHGVACSRETILDHPIIGKWKLNGAKSQVQRITLTVAESAAGEMTMTIAGQSTTFRIDGKDYPAPLDTSAAWTEVGPLAWDSVNKVKGSVVGIDHYLVSADQETLTIRSEYQGDKQDTGQELVFTRTSGDRGLVGTWEGNGAAREGIAEYSAEGDRLRVHVAPPEQRWIGALDGKDVPLEVAQALPEGLTWSGRLMGQRSISFVVKQKGTPVQFATLVVSRDGKTLAVQQIHGASESAPDRTRLVYERQ